MGKPVTLPDYFEWAEKRLGVEFGSERSRNLYDVNLRTAYNTVTHHDFYTQLDMKLKAWSDDYKLKTGSPLLMEDRVPSLLIKPYDSAVNKSFRTNVLWNKSFPRPPSGGWVIPDNLFYRFNDGLRTTLVCKFIDGPNFTVEKLSAYANEIGFASKWYSQEKEEGYYAFHFYVTTEIDFYDANLRMQRLPIQVEIQVTTQLQEVLRGLTHLFYEQNRLEAEVSNSQWKWEYGSNRFRASYLSHTLHLLEAVIVQSRDQSFQTHIEPQEEEGGAV
jgi:hypothetical protein